MSPTSERETIEGEGKEGKKGKREEKNGGKMKEAGK